MPRLAAISDPQRLGDFRAALGRFRERTLQALRSAERGIEDTTRLLDERQAQWTREVAKRKAAVEEARQAYDACRHAPRHRDDPPPDCSDLARALARAKSELQAGEHALETAKTYRRRLEEAAARYRQQATTLRTQIESRSKRAEAALADAQSELEAYQRLTLMGGILGLGTALAVIGGIWKSQRNSIGSAAVRAARKQEIALVRATGHGTRDWTKSELRQLKNGVFPKGYQGHHINNFVRFPELADNPDNIRFLTATEHKAAHQGSFRNNSSGKMYNRKSLMKQWLKSS